MRKYRCNAASCTELIDVRGYCDKHKHLERVPWKGAVRANEDLYQTAEWREIRRTVLLRDERCVKCGSEKGLQIHHVVAPRGNEELFFDVNNCCVLCALCHHGETAREIGKRVRGKM